MAAPTNSGESDMATEDIYLNLSPLRSPWWSPPRLTPSPPRPFLPSSNSNYSMVMQYQGSNQSMDNPPQNQEHDDVVDPAPYLARDSASDWRPSGGGIMTMNNQGFEESNMGFEESMEMTTCFYFPPSPTNFPLYRPLPCVFFVSSEPENISLALSYRHILEDKSGALHVIDSDDIIELLLFDDFTSYVDNKLGDIGQIAIEAGVVPKFVDSLLDNVWDADDDETEATLRRINWLEQDDVDIVDQPVFEKVAVVQQQIQNRGGELDVIFRGGVLTINGLEQRDGQGSPTTPEPLLILQAKLSCRVWLTHDGHWAAEIRFRCSRLNNGRFTTVEDAISAYELVAKWSGWKDLTGFAGLFENENRSNMPLQLPLPAQELNPVEDFGLVCCNGTRNDEIESVGTGSEETEECIMADQARLNSGCLGKRKTMEKNTGGERRSKKTNGVRIAIPLEDILQNKGMRLKDAANHLGVTIAELLSSCREYGIQIWSPRNEQKLIVQPLPYDTLAIIDQEVIPQLISRNVPSDQAFMATVDTNSVVEKEIPLTQFLPTAQQENLDAGFGNDEAEAIGMGGEETGEGVIEVAQSNSGYSKLEGKRKVNTLGRERGNNRTTRVRIAIPKEDILRTKGMCLKEIANHLGAEAIGMGSGSGGTRQSDMEEDQLNSKYLEKERMNEMTPGGERRNKKNAISLEDIFRCKKMPQKVAAKHLKVSITRLKSICREYGIPRWPPRNERKLSRQSLLNETRVVVNQEGIPQLTAHSNQVLMATTDTNSVVEKEILLPQLLPIAQLEKPDVCFDNDEAEAIGIGVEGPGEGVMEEPQLNSGCLRKGKWKEKSPGGDRGHVKTTGVRISISKEEILETKGMLLIDAAKHVKVSRSTFKRACRGYGIQRWPPRKEHKHISQSHPNEPPAVVDQEQISHPNEPPAVVVDQEQISHPNEPSAVVDQEQISHPNEPPAVVDQEQISHPNEPPAVVDQEQIPQLNSDIRLPSDQVLATIGTTNVTIMARYGEERIKFRLSWPWQMVELEQQVKKRLPLEAGTYYIKYKDEDDGLTLIACDEDLEDFISSSSPLGTHSVEVFLEPKVAHEVRVNQL